MEYEGVDLSRLAPVTWFCTILFSLLAEQLAAAGYTISHVRMQSLVVVTLFTGWLAMAGTTQLVHRFHESGKPVRAWAIASVVLFFAAIVVTHGVQSYLHPSG